MNAGQRFENMLFWVPRLIVVFAFMALVVIMLLSNFDLLEPYLLPLHMARGGVVAYGERVTIGPYPHANELQRLINERGIDLDLSLLDDDLPQERALNAALAKRAQNLGIGFKNVPLKYLKMEGEEHKARLAEIVAYLRTDNRHKVYIHCYLGRHRVKAVHDELVRQGMIRENGLQWR